MYELTVERVFSAAHAIRIADHLEPLHGHNWRVRLVVAGEQLNADGLLCDFHVLERELDRIIAPFHNANLNQSRPFDRTNPTAEAVAKHLADEVGRVLPKRVRLVRLSVTEAPGCEAAWVA